MAEGRHVMLGHGGVRRPPYSDLDPASRALLLSQAGPGGSRAITALPTAPELRMPSDCMRVVLLQRLRLPLPHVPRHCRCGGILDALGDHQAACPVACVLGLRGAPLERAAARIFFFFSHLFAPARESSQPSPPHHSRSASRYLCAITGVPRADRQLQQGLRVGPHGSEPCKGRPQPCQCPRRSNLRPGGPHAAADPCEAANESQRPAAEAAPDLQAEHDEAAAAPSARLKLRVRAHLALGSLLQSETRPRIRARSRLPVASDGANQGGVNRDLRPLPQRQLATTSIRRPSVAGTSRLRSRRATLVATSRQMRAAARSSGPALCASTPTCAQAERWSPSSSRVPPQRHRRGASGNASRSRRSRKVRNSPLSTTKSGQLGMAVIAQLAPSPLWDSSRCTIQVRKQHLERALVHSSSGTLLPSSPRWGGGPGIVFQVGGDRALQQRCPSWRVVPLRA